MSHPDRLTPDDEAEIEELSRQLLEFEGDYHYPSGQLERGSHALLKLLEECRTLRAERNLSDAKVDSRSDGHTGE